MYDFSEERLGCWEISMAVEEFPEFIDDHFLIGRYTCVRFQFHLVRSEVQFPNLGWTNSLCLLVRTQM